MRLPRKDWGRLVKAAQKAGWKVEKKKSGAVRLENPGGEVTHIHGTPSTHKRGLQNKRAELRRMGLEV